MQAFFLGKDDIGNVVELADPPKRIVSLVPSISETLFDLGLAPSLLGVTKFCIRPSHLLKTKTVIGGTKNFNFERIDALEPDLIIANKSENYKEGILQLQKQYPVYVTDIESVTKVDSFLNTIGKLTNSVERATELRTKFNVCLKETRNIVKKKRVLYLIWKKPYMAAGTNSFINSVLNHVGLENCVVEARYPELSLKNIEQMHPEIILLSSEPYPFKIADRDVLQEQIKAKVTLIDGEAFSWFGSTLLHKQQSFVKALSALD